MRRERGPKDRPGRVLDERDVVVRSAVAVADGPGRGEGLARPDARVVERLGPGHAVAEGEAAQRDRRDAGRAVRAVVELGVGHRRDGDRALRDVESVARDARQAGGRSSQRVPGSNLVDRQVAERGDATNGSHRHGARERPAGRVRPDGECDVSRVGRDQVAETVQDPDRYGRADRAAVDRARRLLAEDELGRGTCPGDRVVGRGRGGAGVAGRVGRGRGVDRGDDGAVRGHPTDRHVVGVRAGRGHDRGRRPGGAGEGDVTGREAEDRLAEDDGEVDRGRVGRIGLAGCLVDRDRRGHVVIRVVERQGRAGRHIAGEIRRGRIEGCRGVRVGGDRQAWRRKRSRCAGD